MTTREYGTQKGINHMPRINVYVHAVMRMRDARSTFGGAEKRRRCTANAGAVVLRGGGTLGGREAVTACSMV